MDLEIQTQHVTLDPAWRDLIEQSSARIAGRYPETLRLHVTVRRTAHHRAGTETVAVLANVEGGVVRAEKEEEEMRDAIHAVFAALEVGLQRHHEQRRHVTKGTGARLKGSVKRIFRDAGYGFIHHLPGRDVYFRRGALQGLDFDALEPGHPVEFEVEEAERGLQAPRVYPVGARSRV
jgi:ribosomal subunit interface protein